MRSKTQRLPDWVPPLVAHPNELQNPVVVEAETWNPPVMKSAVPEIETDQPTVSDCVTVALPEGLLVQSVVPDTCL